VSAPERTAEAPADGETPMHLIAEMRVKDPAKLLEYGRLVQPMMARAGGEIVGTSATGTEVMEGDWETGLLVIQRWRSREAFDAFWQSPEYAPLMKLRHEACDTRIVTFESAPPDFAALGS
jgi:uncharacterized protein (DUF1330 family)